MRKLCFALALAAFPSVALAQAARTEAARTETPAGPSYESRIADGTRLALARDFDGALAAFEEATRLNPGDAVAFNLIASTHRLRRQLTPALESFRTAARLANAAGDEAAEARALQGIADTLEQTPDKLAEARDAWAALSRFADAHRALVNPEVARARMQAIQAVTDLAQVYAPVRQRIAERERENARPTRARGAAGAR